MLKKFLTRIVAIVVCLLATITSVGLVGCGPQEIQNGDITIDKNKQQIYYYYYAGGTDNTWRIKAAEAWNKTNDTFQVIPWATLNDAFQEELVSNGGNASIVDLTGNKIDAYINAGDVADLSDIYELDVDGNGVKLKEKINNFESYQKLYSTRYFDEGIYAVPGTLSPMHLIYDHDLFKEKGWLIYQKDDNGAPIRDDNGQLVLSLGHDGKSGTYDDGQPVTMAEWEEMLARIKVANNTKAFIFTTKYSHYLEPLIHSLIAQYGGYEGYVSLLQGYGSYYAENGDKITYAANEGYNLYDSPALLKTMQFMDKYFTSSEWVHDKSATSTDFAHKETVNTYIMGFTEEVQQAAFLVEGAYFELENRYYFDLLKQNRYDGRGYGEREYRYMLLPRLSEYDDVSFISTDSAATIVSKDSKNPDREKAAKDFLAFCLKDEYLRERTICSAAVMPFKYSLSEEQKASLTPFQRNAIELCFDTENVKVLSEVDYCVDAVRAGYLDEWATRAYDFTASMSDGNYERPLRALRRFSAQEYVAGIKKYRKESMWGIK